MNAMARSLRTARAAVYAAAATHATGNRRGRP